MARMADYLPVRVGMTAGGTPVVRVAGIDTSTFEPAASYCARSPAWMLYVYIHNPDRATQNQAIRALSVEEVLRYA